MADPKIRYDIQANAQGQENVARLTQELEKLDSAIDPAAAARAGELTAKLRELGQQDAAIGQFVDLKNKTQAAAQALDEAQNAAQALGKQIAATEAPTRAQAGQMEKLRDAVKSAKAELQTQNTALDASRKALTALGVETEGLAKSQIRMRQELAATATEAGVVAQRYQQSATAATAAGRQQVAAHSEVKGSLQGIQSQIQQIQNLALAAVGGSVLGSVAKDVADVADAYKNLGARIKIATGDGEAFTQAFEGVFEVARRTSSSLETTGNLFTRIAEAGKQIGVSQQQALDLTETINQAVQLSGTGAQESEAAIKQLIQGLQSGVLRGEEFNSVMEQAPRLARALADGLGVTTGELRKLAEAGDLSAQRVIQSLQGQSAAVQREFSLLPATVGRALQNLSTEWTRYVGEVDTANGVSSKAAAAIGFLALHLSELATAASVAGQAFVAYKAIDLAGSLLRDAAAAQAAVAAKRNEALVTEASTLARRAEATTVAAATAAKIADTAATAANTAAVGANAAATRAAATANAAAVAAGGASAGVAARLGGALGSAGLAAALFGDLVVSSFKTAGTWIGETAAKLAGYKDRSDEVAQSQKLLDDRAKELAKSTAELAQRTQLAAEKTLGLNDESRKLVGTFTESQKKGDGAAESLEKLTKALKLGDTSGIQAAITALDVLEKRGAIAAYQVSEALGAALKGKDLGIFEVQARAAFDKTEQGARRLQLALEAIGGESLRRVGSSVQELKSGFSEVMNSAVNDTDTLRATLKTLGVDADTAGNLLAKSIDKQIEAANTQKALDRVRTALLEMKSSGEIAGDAVAERLQKVDLKAQEAKRGINGIQEALNVLGIKSKTELQAIAEKSKEAFDIALNSGQVSAAGLATAFQKMASDAIAANGGIEPSWLRQRQLMVENRLAAAGLSTDLVRGMKAAAQAIGEAADAQQNLAAAIKSTPDGDVFTNAGQANRNKSFDSSPFQSGSSASRGPGAPNPTTGTTYTPPPDNSGDWVWFPMLNQNAAGGEWRRSPAAAQRDFEQQQASLGLEKDRFGIWRPRGATGTSGVSGFGTSTGTGPDITDPFGSIEAKKRANQIERLRAVDPLLEPAGDSAAIARQVVEATQAKEAERVRNLPAPVFDRDTPGTVAQYTQVPILGKYEVKFTNERTGISTSSFADTEKQAQEFIDNLQQAFRTANGG